ncbi:hypothetical protein Nos7524_3208 [Nostoc sp. PCC 7524]|uniref:hypothetical protein n=1 Tax=Nostoc sp. (strain ATCC 29411 / PCC 7524) TaxID=28072 RepID=UPI00029F3F8E|nr:hypothetical protein [Nostoc sp. PCC 7524]AFY49008.1 hypothetical protein Nos7524_3208 [Nostoc sp. PCC 7524]
MARKVVMEEMKQISSEHTNSLVSEGNNNEFQVEFNQEEGIVRFQLTDGTLIQLNSPKAKQFLLLDSYLKVAEEEFRTESFIALKLASLCITKFGDRDKISFNELLDILEIEDVERMAASLNCFRDKLEYLARKSDTI